MSPHQFRVRITDFLNLVQEILRAHHLICDITCECDFGKVGREGDFGGFGIDHQVDVGAEVGLEHAAGYLEEVVVDVTAHYDEFFGEGGKVIVGADGESDVGHGAAGV